MDRFIWQQNRIEKEGSGKKTSLNKKERRRKWKLFQIFLKIGKVLLDLCGIGAIGRKNAIDFEVNVVNHTFKDFPSTGTLKILHLSDFHLNDFPNILDPLIKKLEGLEYDMAVLTGDFYSFEFPTSKLFKVDYGLLEKLVNSIKAKHGIFAVLGNHDSATIVSKLEGMGVDVLINQEKDINFNDGNIRVIGTDDVHYFYTEDAATAISRAKMTWSMALIHSPEAYSIASKANVKLYLCGHTHGGQVCLPGGIAIITNTKSPRYMLKGKWTFNNMVGYTNVGVGTNTLPYRFFSRPEVAIHHISK